MQLIQARDYEVKISAAYQSAVDTDEEESTGVYHSPPQLLHHFVPSKDSPLVLGGHGFDFLGWGLRGDLWVCVGNTYEI